MSRPLQFALVDTFGSWTVIDSVRVSQWKKSFYWVQCVCARTGLRSATKLKNGIHSCVCLGSQKQRAAITQHGGTSKSQTSRLYDVWQGMKNRCTINPKSHDYPIYAARGIKVCEEWEHDFVAFRDWALSHGYQPGLYLDRRENNLSYSPDNCRFVTAQGNSINRRITKFYSAFGELKTLSEWSRDPRCCVCLNTLAARMDKKHRWDIYRALLTPPRF